LIVSRPRRPSSSSLSDDRLSVSASFGSFLPAKYLRSITWSLCAILDTGTYAELGLLEVLAASALHRHSLRRQDLNQKHINTSKGLFRTSSSGAATMRRRPARSSTHPVGSATSICLLPVHATLTLLPVFAITSSSSVAAYFAPCNALVRFVPAAPTSTRYLLPSARARLVTSAGMQSRAGQHNKTNNKTNKQIRWCAEQSTKSPVHRAKPVVHCTSTKSSTSNVACEVGDDPSPSAKPAMHCAKSEMRHLKCEVISQQRNVRSLWRIM
jgi:hypothetical protein